MPMQDEQKPPADAGPVERPVRPVAEAGRVAHWLCGSVPFHSCGNCTRAYSNCWAVGIRLGCWNGHHQPTFLLPTDGTKCADFVPKVVGPND
jgi:hypothetical protein